jgi:hypothetical protein
MNEGFNILFCQQNLYHFQCSGKADSCLKNSGINARITDTIPHWPEHPE